MTANLHPRSCPKHTESPADRSWWAAVMLDEVRPLCSVATCLAIDHHFQDAVL